MSIILCPLSIFFLFDDPVMILFLLLPFQGVSDQTTIKAANGKSLKALTVFSHSIKFLKDEALKVICERTGDTYFSVSDIQWVLTVPAIWTPVAKQFMREAAYEVRFL